MTRPFTVPVDGLELGHRGGRVEVAHGSLDRDEVCQEAGGNGSLVVGRGRRRGGCFCLIEQIISSAE